MEENLHKDNLESFFKKEFEQLPETPANDGWDTPSNEVWGGIEEGLSSGAAGFFISWKMLILGTLILALAGTTFYLIQKNNTLSEDLRLKAMEIETLNESLSKEKNNTREIKAIQTEDVVDTQNNTANTAEANQVLTDNLLVANSKKEKPLELNKKSVPTTKQDKPVKNTVSKTTDIAEKNSIPDTGQGQKITNPELALTNPEQNTTTEFNAPVNQKSVAKITLPLNFIATPEIPLPGSIKLSETSISQIKPVKNITCIAGAYLAPNFTSNSTMSSGGEPLLFRNLEKEAVSNEYGIKLGVKFGNHWKITSGVGIYNSALTSRQVFRINFNPAQETQTGDEFQSTYALSVPSSYGDSDVEVDFRRSSSDQFNQGQHILLDVRTKQKLKFINIPLIVGYEWGKGRFKYGIQSGISLNILKATVFEAEIASKNMKFRRHNPLRVTRKASATKKTTLDYVLSAGVAYEISPSLRLSVDPVFRKNITASISTEDFSNKLYSLGLHVGAYYQF
jgi:hypothetical protein